MKSPFLRYPLLVLAWAGSVVTYLLLCVAVLLVVVAARPLIALPLAKAALEPLGIDLTVAEMTISRDPVKIGFIHPRVVFRREVNAEFTADTIEILADPRQLLSGERVLKRVTILSPRAEIILPDGDRETGEPVDWTRMIEAFPAERLILEKGTLRVVAPQGVMAAEDLVLDLTGDGPLHMTLQAHVGIDTADESVRGQGKVLVSVHEQKDGLSVQTGVEHGRIASPWITGPLEGESTVSVQGTRVVVQKVAATMDRAMLRDSQGEIRAETNLWIRAGAGGDDALDVQAQAGDLLNLEGMVTGVRSAQYAVDLKGVVPRSDLLLDIVSPLLPDETAKLAVQGRVPFHLTGPAEEFGLTLLPEQLKVSWADPALSTELSGEATLTGIPGGAPKIQSALSLEAVSAAIDGMRLGQGQGRIRLDGDLSAPQVHGELSFSDMSLDTEQASISRAEGSLQINGKVPEIRIPAFSIVVSEENLTLGGSVYPLGTVSLSGQAEIFDNWVRLPELVLKSSRVGTVQGMFAASSGEGAGKFRATGITVSDIAALVPDQRIAQWGPEGTVDLNGDLVWSRGYLNLDLQTAVSDFSFASPEGTILAQGGGLRVQGSYRAGTQRRFDIRARADKGEFLMDTVYLNLDDSPVSLALYGVPEKGGGFSSGVIDVELDEHFSIEITDAFLQWDNAPVYKGRLQIQKMDLEKTFETFVRDPFSLSNPVLADLRVTGQGRAGLAVSGRGGEVSVDGNIAVTGGNILGKDESLQIRSITLDMPVAYRFGSPVEEDPVPEKMGLLHIESAGTPVGDVTGLRLPVALVPNRLLLRGALSVPLYDGALRVADLQVSDPLSAGFEASMGVRLSPVDMAQIPSGDYGLTGTIGGDLGVVRVNRAALRAEGQLIGSFFGADMLVDDITVENPFGSARAYGADVSLRQMHLNDFSRSIGFGKITGRMDLDVEDLRVAFGQPVSFELLARSIPVKGVEQKVSLDAVNSISVVGTGASLTSTAITLFRPFVQEFNYQTIGFECSLSNDVFRVQGLIQEGGVEYLVKKPPLFGINVINRNPDNRISFKDMLARLNRVLETEQEGEGENL